MRKNPGTIYFRNSIQAALFIAELSGQISDGYWENSRPHNHWELPCLMDIKVDEAKPRVEFNGFGRFQKNYNFAAPQLLEVVGDRMVNIANLTAAGLDILIVREFDEYDERYLGECGEYWVKKNEKFLKTFGSYENYQSLCAKAGITLKDVKKELNDMKTIFSSTPIYNTI